MVCFNQLVLGFFIVQIYVNAAPSDTTEVPAPVESEEPKREEQSENLEINENTSAQSQRQKRQYYNFNGFPPINPFYPTYNKRDQYRDTAVYGIDDPLTQIHRQLAEIASAARHPIPPPPPINFPFYYPVFYIPQLGCDCKPQQQPQPQPNPGPNQNQTGDPGIENRFPVLEDERQNWGLVNNDTDEDYDENEDFSRPISFDPIMVGRPMKRPPPPVEHGSSQSGQGEAPSTTTARPPPPPMAPPTKGGPAPPNPSSNQAPFAAPYPGNFALPEIPSLCDGAVISCCHQVQVTYSCFALQGCPDPTFLGNPCDPQVILRVIEKYQRYYGRRNG